MIEINLLPNASSRSPSRRVTASASAPESLRQLGGDPWLIGLGVAAMLIVLWAGWSFWSTASAAARLQARIDQEAMDSIQHASAIALVTSLRANQDTIRQKIDVIQGVDTRRYVWPRVLDEVSRAIPASTWLTRMASTELPDSLGGPTFTLEGAAGTTEALTRFMKNLEASPLVHEVGLVTTEQVVTDGQTFHRFTLEARYQTPDPAMVETVPLSVSREVP